MNFCWCGIGQNWVKLGETGQNWANLLWVCKRVGTIQQVRDRKIGLWSRFWRFCGDSFVLESLVCLCCCDQKFLRVSVPCKSLRRNKYHEQIIKITCKNSNFQHLQTLDYSPPDQKISSTLKVWFHPETTPTLSPLSLSSKHWWSFAVKTHLKLNLL